jgi:Uma2 family endonuclease
LATRQNRRGALAPLVGMRFCAQYGMVMSMALPAALHCYAYDEYLQVEAHSLVRHEFIGGEIYAMAGGSPEHAALASVVMRLIGNQLPPSCRTYSSDLRIRIHSANASVYPDGTVICGKVVRAVDDPLAAVNPTLIVEVTSPSTESYDRGDKLAHYKLLPTLREVLVVSHATPHVELHRRTDAGWTTIEVGPNGRIELESIAAHLLVNDVYALATGE